MRRAKFTMPVEAFHLPKGTSVWSIALDPNQTGLVEVYIEHPDLPDTADGMVGPEVSPVWSQPLDEAGNPTGPVEWKVLT